MQIKKVIKTYQDIPAGVKSAFWFTVSTFVLRGIAFITTPIFTRIMDPSQFGHITTYNSWHTILEVFALLGLTSAGVFNVGLNDYKDSRDRYISSILLLCNLSTIVTFGILFAAQKIAGTDFVLPGGLMLIMFISFLFTPAQTFWITRQRYEYKYKLATVITIGSAILTQAAAVVCVMNTPGDRAAEVKLWSSGLAGLLVCVPIYIYLFVRGRTGFDKKIWKQTLIFALPLLPHYLAQHVMSGSDRIMISEMISSADAAVYGVVAAISTLATYVWSAVNASLVPYAYEKLNEKKYADLDKVVTELIVGYGIVCFGIALIAPEVLAILAPKEYSYGVYAVPPIVGYSFLSAFYNIYSTIEFYHKKSANITLATIVACAVNLILNAVFIPRFGLIAAAYTTLISNAVLIMMHYRGYRKCQHERVYNDRRLIFIALITIMVCELCNLLYINTAVRWAVIAFIVVLCVWERRFIISRIKEIRKNQEKGNSQ